MFWLKEETHTACKSYFLSTHYLNHRRIIYEIFVEQNVCGAWGVDLVCNPLGLCV